MIADKRESLREQQKQLVREAILEAATTLIAERGVAQLSMDDIAARSGLSKGSLYNYFSGRDQLILTVVQKHLNVFLQKADPYLNRDKPAFASRFQNLLHLMLDTMEHSAGVIEIFDHFLMECIHSRGSVRRENPEPHIFPVIAQFHEAFTPFYAKACARGEIRGDHPQALSISIVSMMYHLFQAKHQGLGFPREDIVPFMLKVFLP